MTTTQATHQLPPAEAPGCSRQTQLQHGAGGYQMMLERFDQETDDS